MKRALATAALLVVSLTVGITIAEILVRWHAASQIKEHLQAQLLPGTLPGIDFELGDCPQCTPRINALGFRGPEVGPKPAGTYRVAVVGDSATFGSMVDEDERTLPGRLAVLLNAAGRGARFEVINAGVPGYNVRQIYYTLLYKVLPLKPDLVVYNLFPNDMDNEVYERRRVGGKDLIVFKLYTGPEGIPLHGIPDAVHALLNDHLFLYKYVTWTIHNRRLRGRTDLPGGLTPGQVANLQYIDKFAALCRAHGAIFVLSTTAYSRCAAYHRVGDPIYLAHGPMWCENARRLMDAALTYAAKAGIPAVDLQPSVQNSPLDQLVVDPRDHYTALGNETMAGALFEFLARLYDGGKGKEAVR